MTQLGEGVSPPGVEPEEKKAKEKKKVKVRMSVFFDGTLNNRKNTEHRLADTDIYKDNKKQGNSYENDHTNVAKMERYIKDAAGYDITLSLYVEGPGTIDDQSDKLFGYALGTGKSGVVKKVEAGVKKTVNKILKELNTDDIVEILTLDTFGFSRGAAGARNFVHESLITGKKPVQTQIESKNHQVKKVEFCFVGLYDTVSSHGIIYSNDTSDLKLDAIRNARQVVQLAAAEEHRKNFSLTTIQSAGSKKGKQIFLPGVHSDIGGSYTDNSDEDFDIYQSYNSSEAEDDRASLIAAGWYKPDELTMREKNIMRGKRRIKKTIVQAKRSKISNQYSRIPLQIMAKFAREHGVEINPKLESVESIPGALSKVDKKLKKYADSAANSSASDWKHDEDWLKDLRHKHLHFSAKLSFGLAPRFINGQRNRKYYRG